MNKLWAAAFLFVLASTGYLFWHKGQVLPTKTTTHLTTSPSIPSKSSPVTQSTTNQPKIKPKHIAVDTHTPTKNSQEFKARSLAQQDVVEFQVIGDDAIAFGDIILGQPEPGTQLESGYYQPEPLLLWDHDVPYGIDPELPDPERIQSAIEYFNEVSPIRFVPFAGEPDAVIFTTGSAHCYSSLGKKGGHQPIKLSTECDQPEILHEMMHSLGFIHEHSRFDRNDFVEVNWGNIEDKNHIQFSIVPEHLMETIRGTPFDYKSIMLYRPNFFAKNKQQPTLISRTKSQLTPSATLSTLDLERLRQVYGVR